MPSTDTFLTERLALDDQAAFENLHERYFVRLFNYAVRKTGSLPAEARRPIYEPVSVAFSDASMNDVIDQLEICFNVRIRAANSAVNACRLTADFTNQSLPEILELLCASLDATYTMTGETVIINSEGCS